jgi:hypothetical protein
MLRSKRLAVATAALVVAVGATPALAGDGSVPAPEQVLISELGLTAEQIDYLQSQGLAYAQIYVLYTAATRMGIDPLVLLQSLDGKVAWGKLMRLFDANFGALLAAHRGNGG